MTLENGPFLFSKNSTRFRVNEFAWNKKANILYLQSPGGVNQVGFRLDSALAIVITLTMIPQLPKITIKH